VFDGEPQAGLAVEFAISNQRVSQIYQSAVAKVEKLLRERPDSANVDDRLPSPINYAIEAYSSGRCRRGNGKSRSAIHDRIQLGLLCEAALRFMRKTKRPVTLEAISEREGISIEATRECLLELLRAGAVERCGRLCFRLTARKLTQRELRALRNQWTAAPAPREKRSPCRSTPRLEMMGLIAAKPHDAVYTTRRDDFLRKSAERVAHGKIHFLERPNNKSRIDFEPAQALYEKWFDLPTTPEELSADFLALVTERDDWQSAIRALSERERKIIEEIFLTEPRRGLGAIARYHRMDSGISYAKMLALVHRAIRTMRERPKSLCAPQNVLHPDNRVAA
jgi:hypothetical protein